MANFEIFDQPS